MRLDCEVSWTIDDDIVWQPASCRPKAVLRLHWAEEIPRGTLGRLPELDFGPRQLPAFHGATLACAAQAMFGVPNFLYGIEAAQPQSFSPELVGESRQDLRLPLYAPVVELKANHAGDLVWPPAPTSIRTPLRLSVASEADLLLTNDKNNPGKRDGLPPSLAVKAHVHSLFTNPAPALDFTLTPDRRWIPADWEAAALGIPYFASFPLATRKAGA